VVWFLNRSFYRLLHRRGGWRLAVAGAWLHIVYFLCALSGFAAAWWVTLLGQRGVSVADA
jgi:hypothetical protein